MSRISPSSCSCFMLLHLCMRGVSRALIVSSLFLLNNHPAHPRSLARTTSQASPSSNVPMTTPRHSKSAWRHTTSKLIPSLDTTRRREYGMVLMPLNHPLSFGRSSKVSLRNQRLNRSLLLLLGRKPSPALSKSRRMERERRILQMHHQYTL